MPRGQTSKKATGGSRRGGATGGKLRFSQKLILNKWMLSLFGASRFEELVEHIRDEHFERLDENNVHNFHKELCLRLPADKRPDLPDARLLEYDQNIVSVTQRLNERRLAHGEPPIVWKYFQYLALLFTEIYLDWYFRDPEALRAALNEQIAAFNAGEGSGDPIEPFGETEEAWIQLNKIAFWMATGSGKTLLMHAHILQYRRFLETHDLKRTLNRIILLTPNEGLSQQHLREFEKSGINAEIFSKDRGSLFSGHAVEIIEVTKLKDDMGKTSVAVDAFENNNLVLVDEGHRGASSGVEGVWMKARDQLCERGFSFEYSATFGQVVRDDKKLTNRYARGTLFDYSYRWFYDDGFGKDYQILNLEDDRDAEWMARYLTACLLAFHQQLKLFRDHREALRPFNLEKPLWIFVGGSVTASLSERDATDVVEILQFLDRYVADRTRSVELIRQVLGEGLPVSNGRNLFADRFTYLEASRLTPEQIFDETLDMLFNAPGGGALRIENLKGAAGEIALRVGENDPFGAVNVGDDAKLVKLCEAKGLNAGEKEFAGSLFHGINEPRSTVNVLVGSKKFTEGWNSWRVSTMGLMRIGKNEGSQIIQLFGRGVRLKGYGMTLKRSAEAELPDDVVTPRHLQTLETLNVFGVRADYMRKFREFLELEGVTMDNEVIVLPIKKNIASRPLRTIRVKEQINGVPAGAGAFKKLGPIPTLRPPDDESEYLAKNVVVVDWYPKVQMMKSAGVVGGDDGIAPDEGRLTEQHVAFLDLDRLYFDLERFKAERNWFNLNLTRSGIAELLADRTWYRLQIPASLLAFDDFKKVRVWQEVALALLKKYTERYYTFRRQAWELPHLEYADVTEDDSSFPVVKTDEGEVSGYRVEVDPKRTELIDRLKVLKSEIEQGHLKPFDYQGVKAICFGQHLYEPLLYIANSSVKSKPTALKRSEFLFITHLMKFYEGNLDYFADRELYLLRNLSLGRGLGFFEAGNFHPDFILWQLVGDRQFVAFVDPKGIRQVPLEDPKIRFHETIKGIERRLQDANVTLSSFIVSPTSLKEMRKFWRIEKSDMRKRNVLFQVEDENSYIGDLLRSAVGNEP